MNMFLFVKKNKVNLDFFFGWYWLYNAIYELIIYDNEENMHNLIIIYLIFILTWIIRNAY